MDKDIFDLPEGYSEIKRIDLVNDTKLAVQLSIGALVIAVAVWIIGHIIVPFGLAIFEPDNIPSWLIYMSAAINIPSWILQIIGVLISLAIYVIIHELIHGAFFKLYSGRRAKYGFAMLTPYCGSDAYYNKRQYVIIGLAPVVLSGIVLLGLNIVLPAQWFWWVYLIQVMNLSGAAGDIYMAGLMNRLPADILIHDEGVAMTIYAREGVKAK